MFSGDWLDWRCLWFRFCWFVGYGSVIAVVGDLVTAALVAFVVPAVAALASVPAVCLWVLYALFSLFNPGRLLGDQFRIIG